MSFLARVHTERCPDQNNSDMHAVRQPEVPAGEDGDRADYDRCIFEKSEETHAIECPGKT